MENDPISEEAVRLASGSLGFKLAQFPVLFARAIVFGRRRSELPADSIIKNGTATLVDLGTGPIAVTCAHVLAEYRHFRECNDNVFFQIGNVPVDPSVQLIEENPDMDLATIRLSQKQAAKINGDGVSGSSIFQPTMWPPRPVQEGENVALGGFPGSWREMVAFDAIDFYSFSIGATAVSSVGEDRFACRFERDRWVSSQVYTPQFSDAPYIGGLSGGPAFAIRGLHYDFVGIISEFSTNLDILFLKPTHLIGVDGSIGLNRVNAKRG